MKRRIIIVSASLVVMMCAGMARAEAMFGAVTGYNRGTISRSTEETFTAFSAQGFVGYSFSYLNIHAFFQHMDLSYSFNDAAYQGLYSGSGVGVGLSRYLDAQTKAAKISLTAQMPASSTLILLSETRGQVNGASYVHSTLATLQGGSAFQAMAGYEWLVVGRGGKSKVGENFYCGVLVGYMSQTFTEQKTRIKTNNSVLAPSSPGKETVNHKLTLMSLNLSVTYDLY